MFPLHFPMSVLQRFPGLNHCLCISRGKRKEFFPDMSHPKDLRISPRASADCDLDLEAYTTVHGILSTYTAQGVPTLRRGYLFI